MGSESDRNNPTISPHFLKPGIQQISQERCFPSLPHAWMVEGHQAWGFAVPSQLVPWVGVEHVAINKPTPVHQCYIGSVVYIGVYSWCQIFNGLGQIYDGIYLLFSHHKDYFHIFIPSQWSTCSSCTLPVPDHHWSFTCLFSFLFSRMRLHLGYIVCSNFRSASSVSNNQSWRFVFV